MAQIDKKKIIVESVDPFDAFDEIPAVESESLEEDLEPIVEEFEQDTLWEDVDDDVVVDVENPFVVEFEPEFLEVSASDYDDEYGEEPQASEISAEEQEQSEEPIAISVEEVKEVAEAVAEEVVAEIAPEVPAEEAAEVIEDKVEEVVEDKLGEEKVPEDEQPEDVADAAAESEESTEDSEESSDHEEDDESDDEELDEALLLETTKGVINKNFDKFIVCRWKASGSLDGQMEFKTIQDAMKYAQQWSKKSDAGDKGASIFGGEIDPENRLVKFVKGHKVDNDLKATAKQMKKDAKADAGMEKAAAKAIGAQSTAEEEAAAAKASGATPEPEAKAEEPKVEEPKADEPATEEPKAEEPAAEEPAASEEAPAEEAQPEAPAKRDMSKQNAAKENNKKIVNAFKDAGLDASELITTATNKNGKEYKKASDTLLKLRKALFGESLIPEAFEDDDVLDERAMTDVPFDSEAKIGDKIRIVHLEGEGSEYDGKEGTIENIDGIGQLHGTWGGLAVIPGVDEFEIINEDYTGTPEERTTHLEYVDEDPCDGEAVLPKNISKE